MSRNSRPKPEVQQLDDRTVPAAFDPQLVPLPPLPLATVGGTVFADLNGSGGQESPEPALAGVAVTLRNADGSVRATTVTAADGAFNFAGVADGLLTVVASPTNGGPNSADVVRPVSVAMGASPAPLSLAVRATGTVSGAAFADNNGNNRRDVGEGGVGGATVVLDLYGSGKAPLTATTAADGSYKLTGVPDGQHRLTVTGPRAAPTGRPR